MKRAKKLMVALLTFTCISVPLTACGGKTSSATSQTSQQIRVQSIEITKMPTKTVYEVGDLFDPTGMEVTAKFNDGTSRVVEDYTYPTSPLDTSTTQVTITYQGRRAYVPITVNFVEKITEIKVEVQPNKTNYVVGETFDPTGMKVVGYWNTNKKTNISDYTYDKTGPLTLDDKYVTISYENLTCKVAITVTEEVVTGITVTKNPTKMSYLVGETFDPTGMEVSTVTNAGKKTALSASDYTYDKTSPLTLADTVVTISYNDMTTTLKIAVSEAALTGISITSQPTKTEYLEGETFDPAGMVVTANYEGGKTETITDYEIDKTGPLATSDTEVTISYGGFTAKVTIVVNAIPNKVKVDSLGTTRIEAEYLDTSEATLREDFIAAGRTFLEAGEGASNGYNICGYNPGSKFKISVETDKDAKIMIRARMSDTDLGYPINEGLKFTFDDDVLTADEPGFYYAGTGDYWNWVEFNIGEVEVTPGEHTFMLESINRRPNLDCFDFVVIEYGDEVAEKEVTGLKLTASPSKTQYEVGETFDPAGMVVEATYNTFQTEVVTDYTIEPNRPLELSDDKVTISYGGFSVEVPIIVGKAYVGKINTLGDNIIEAENMPQDGLKIRADVPAGTPYVVDAPGASNGKSIERYDVGSVIEFPFYVGADSKTHLTLRAANYEEIVFDEGVEVKIDGEVITSNNPKLGHRYDNDFYNWVDVDYGTQELTMGEHTITITFTNAKPNLDCINFHAYEYGEAKEEHTLESIYVSQNPNKMNYQVGETFDPTGMVIMGKYSDSFDEVVTEYTVDKTSPLTIDDSVVTITAGELTTTLNINIISPMFTVTEASDFKVEAETLDLSNLVPDAPGYSQIENSGAASSNGQNVGHFSQGYIEGYFVTETDLNLIIESIISNADVGSTSKTKISSIQIDDIILEFDEVALGPDGDNLYYNYKTVTTESVAVSKGSHTFRITFQSGANVDYFNFKFSA